MWKKIIFDTPNKELNKAIEDKVRDELRSTPESNPREPDTTIIDDFLKLKELIDKHQRLKEGKYE